MVKMIEKPAAPTSDIADVCMTPDYVVAERNRKLAELKKENPGTEFELQQTGPRYRSFGATPPPESAAQKQAQEANAALPHGCDGMQIKAVGPKAKPPSP